MTLVGQINCFGLMAVETIDAPLFQDDDEPGIEAGWKRGVSTGHGRDHFPPAYIAQKSFVGL